MAGQEPQGTDKSMSSTNTETTPYSDKVPPIPPRDYQQKAALPHYSSPVVPLPPPAYRPNEALPAFIRLLAISVFLVGGSTAAFVTWFYQRFVFPKLVIRLKMITMLHEAHLVSYSNLVEMLHEAKKGKGFASFELSRDRSVVPVANEDEQIPKEGIPGYPAALPAPPETAGAKPDLPSSSLKSSSPSATPSPESESQDASPSPEPIPERMPLLSPLSSSLRFLTSSLQSFPSPPVVRPLASSLASPSPSKSPTPTSELISSLTSLSAFITSQTYVSLSSAYQSPSGYGGLSSPSSSPFGGSGTGLLGSGAVGFGSGVVEQQRLLKEAVGGFKTQARAVKGALLNRRTFTPLVRTEASVPTTTY